ncbi:MAG: divalent-cation tolerance protein CutA [Sphingobium sp.]|jgi:periplasmic divalent cation tolerance protein|nr:divalent-cation tolerance protein CutA [Sphingobium sp.]
MCAVGGRDEAEAIATALVEARLAACVQLMPVDSVYRWEGAVERSREVMLHAKTMHTKLAEAEALIKARHSYAVPEIIALPIVGGSAEYLDWIRAEVSAPASR